MLHIVAFTDLSSCKAVQPKQGFAAEPDKLQRAKVTPHQHVQGVDQERATQSLDQTGVSTSAQVAVNIRTDLGGVESSGLHAQCFLDADSGHTSLQKVDLQPDFNPNRPPLQLSFASLSC